MSLRHMSGTLSPLPTLQTYHTILPANGSPNIGNTGVAYNWIKPGSLLVAIPTQGTLAGHLSGDRSRLPVLRYGNNSITE